MRPPPWVRPRCYSLRPSDCAAPAARAFALGRSLVATENSAPIRNSRKYRRLKGDDSLLLWAAVRPCDRLGADRFQRIHWSFAKVSVATSDRQPATAGRPVGRKPSSADALRPALEGLKQMKRGYSRSQPGMTTRAAWPSPSGAAMIACVAVPLSTV